MTRGLRLISTWFVLLCVGPVAPALAINTPPGNSAGNQYVETLPGASTNKAVAPESGRGLPAQVRRVLAAQGEAGLVVLGLVGQTPGQTSGPARAHARRRSRSIGLARRALAIESPIPAIGGVLTGTGSAGLGWGLPAVLVLITVFALVLATRNRSRTGSDG